MKSCDLLSPRSLLEVDKEPARSPTGRGLGRASGQAAFTLGSRNASCPEFVRGNLGCRAFVPDQQIAGVASRDRRAAKIRTHALQRATVRPPESAPRCHSLTCYRFTCGAGIIGKVGSLALTPDASKCWRVAPGESNPFSRLIVINREMRFFPNATVTARSQSIGIVE
jgi:hypothetical protein